MLVKGKQTQCVDVEITPTELVNAVDKMYDNYLASTGFFKGEYIDHVGYWQIYDGDDHHTGCRDYTKGPKATEAELAIDKERKVFRDVLLRIKNA